jgi:hypothetical protein
MLAKARRAAGFDSQQAIGDAAGTDRTTANKAETGAYPPTREVLMRWLEQCNVTGLLHEMFVGLWKLARAKDSGGPVKIWFSGYLEAEGLAHTLRLWQPLIFHGLFQTPAYTRALLAAAGVPEDAVQEQLGLRAQRQEILTRPQLPNIIAVVDESALYKLIGSPEIMREQLARLLDLSEQVVIQVVPNKIGANAGLGGAITLAAASGTPEVLLAEALVEDQVTQDIPQVLAASATFDHVRGDAASRAESRTLIREAMERWSQ